MLRFLSLPFRNDARRVAARALTLAWALLALLDVGAALAWPAPARARESEDEGKPATDDDLNPKTATPDPAPPVPELLEHKPRESRLAVVEQAGVGGPLSYGSATVLEVGGSGALAIAGQHLYLRMAPYVAWFVLDGLQLSYTHEVYFAKQEDQFRFATAVMLGVSAHFRLTDRLLLGVGPECGPLYNSDAWGVLLRGKLGLDILVGRSAVLHPGWYAAWSSVDTIDPGGALVNGERFAVGFEIAYGAMF